jgi:hypothetical protein
MREVARGLDKRDGFECECKIEWLWGQGGGSRTKSKAGWRARRKIRTFVRCRPLQDLELCSTLCTCRRELRCGSVVGRGRGEVGKTKKERRTRKTEAQTHGAMTDASFFRRAVHLVAISWARREWRALFQPGSRGGASPRPSKRRRVRPSVTLPLI